MNFGFGATYIALWILVIFQGLLILALLRQIWELRRLAEQAGFPGDHRLPIGSAAPEFDVRDFQSGESTSSKTIAGGGMLMFLSPGCGTCRRLAAGLGQFVREDSLKVIAFCNGETTACSRFSSLLNPTVPLVLDDVTQVAMLYGVSSYPTVVLIDDEQRVLRYGFPEDIDDLKQIVNDVVRHGWCPAGS